MADPITLGVSAAVGIGSSIFGGLLGASAAEYSGEAKAQAALYQAGVAEQNARIAKQNAEYERSVGGVEALRQGIKSRFEGGRIRAAKSASGLDVNVGSAAEVQESQRTIAAMDQRTIRQNAARRAYGYQIEEVSQKGQANLYRAQAVNARIGAEYDATASILGGITSASSQFARASSAGMFGGGGARGGSSMGNPTQIGSLY